MSRCPVVLWLPLMSHVTRVHELRCTHNPHDAHRAHASMRFEAARFPQVGIDCCLFSCASGEVAGRGLGARKSMNRLLLRCWTHRQERLQKTKPAGPQRCCSGPGSLTYRTPQRGSLAIQKVQGHFLVLDQLESSL